MSLLVLNAGSSSLKLRLFDAQARESLAGATLDWSDPSRPSELVVRRDGEASRTPCDVSDHRAAAQHAIDAVVRQGGHDVAAVGHRVVHGGSQFHESVRVDDSVRAGIARLAELAPLHNPAALDALDAAESALPGVPQVAAFDTAFYADLPLSAAVYPLPYEWFADWGFRRYGFHGISHAYVAGRAAELLGRELKDLRIVSCHLGNGCSATATAAGRAVDTTMGYTPLDGLMMGTRSGSVDPMIVLEAIRRRGLSPDDVDDALNHRSGLLGLSGIGSDFRQVEAAADRGDDRAKLALDIYAHRIRSAVGSLSATLGGLDALVFTAGVGENSATLRARVCEGLGFLGVRLDPGRNARAKPDADVASQGSTARVLVIETKEELLIAREARRLARGGDEGPAA